MDKIIAINPAHLERLFQVMQDIKKELAYDKHTGLWSWHDRDEPEVGHGEFPTALDAMIDATKPYFNPED